jgi:hypothetical protein
MGGGGGGGLGWLELLAAQPVKLRKTRLAKAVGKHFTLRLQSGKLMSPSVKIETIPHPSITSSEKNPATMIWILAIGSPEQEQRLQIEGTTGG